MTEPKISTVASYTVVQSLGTAVARTAHITSSVLVDLDENGAVAGIEAIGTSVGVSELLDVIRWLRAPALSAPSEPVPDGPRVWEVPTIPADVTQLVDGSGDTWRRGEAGGWVMRASDGSVLAAGLDDSILLTSYGPVTEAIEP
jgi:uncharacterized protein YuzE